MVPIRLHALLTFAVLITPRSTPVDRPGVEAVGDVVVVVNAAVRGSPNAAELRRIFLARQRFWDDGTPIRPVNLGATSAERTLFTRRILGGEVRDYTSYWNDLWFHGTAPPPVLGSGEAVLLYVARTPGAIGYLDAADLPAAPEGIRVLLRLASS